MPAWRKIRRINDALFAMTLSSGLQADYAALIEKRNLASLHYTKEASAWAQQLLAVCARLLRRAAGHRLQQIHHRQHGGAGALDSAHGRACRAISKAGIADLQLTAEHGHYLAPFARILLAIAYVREKDQARARCNC